MEKVAGAMSSADLYHWSAMVWGEHWRQRLSLELVWGQADLVLEAVSVVQSSSSGAKGCHWQASAEWSLTDCRTCVSLQ